MARFRKLYVEDPNQHHDALEFSNGTVVMLTHLLPGQKARVLQLPADPAKHNEKREPALEAVAETVAEVYRANDPCETEASRMICGTPVNGIDSASHY